MSIKVDVVDVGGSLRRLVAMGPRTIRVYAKPAIRVSAHAVADRIRSTVHVSDRPPHLKDNVEVAVHPDKLFADVGFFSDPDMAAVALYEEYNPNQHPFMRPALEAEENEFHARFVKALKAAAAALEQ